MIMSTPGAMPSSSVPRTVPVKPSGVMPESTVRPVTAWSRATSSSGKVSGQAGSTAEEAAGAVAVSVAVAAAAREVAMMPARVTRDRWECDRVMGRVLSQTTAAGVAATFAARLRLMRLDAREVDSVASPVTPISNALYASICLPCRDFGPDTPRSQQVGPFGQPSTARRRQNRRTASGPSSSDRVR